MDDVTGMIEKSQNGDKEIRNTLIEENPGLVRHIVKRYLGRGYEAEDLFQIGVIGLIKAVDHFDIRREVRFSTYAVPLIIGEIKRFFRDDGMVKISRNIKENAYRIRQMQELFKQQNEKDATIQDVSAMTGLSHEDIVFALESSYEVESIYQSVYQSDGSEIYLLDRLTDGKDEHEKAANRIVLENLLAQMEEKERQLILLRYYENRTQVEVAKTLGISQVQVSRLEKKLLLKMRSAL
ncbi:MAG TPA: SigB/SigF/SigG family RNA polymerase sigma factor [Lachnospiraceae bacterium]|nr:SigB/SigF/SigG family RNA polymerase sigma factor [Lachnospiraceae bacterium]HPF28741.1 SigB/SigF/SigG family RNA polymerase sigma factor [Lachnospiraceae bacterium]